jgi:hypothetical protein
MKKTEKHPESSKSNVVPLARKRKEQDDSSVAARQQLIRDLYRQAADNPPDKAAIAGLYFVMTASGTMRTVAINIEPEHVDAFLSAIEPMRIKLAKHKERGNVLASIRSLFDGGKTAVKAAAFFAVAVTADAHFVPASAASLAYLQAIAM